MIWEPLGGRGASRWSRREPRAHQGATGRVAAGSAHARRAVGEEIFPVACGLDGIANVGDLAAAALGWKGRIDLLVNSQCDARSRNFSPPSP